MGRTSDRLLWDLWSVAIIALHRCATIHEQTGESITFIFLWQPEESPRASRPHHQKHVGKLKTVAESPRTWNGPVLTRPTALNCKRVPRNVEWLTAPAVFRLRTTSSAQITGVLANMSALNGSRTGTSLLEPEEGCATDRPLDQYHSRRKGSTPEPERNMDVKVCPCTRERNPGSGFHAKGNTHPNSDFPLFIRDKHSILESVCIVAPSTYRDDRLCVWARLKTLGIKSTSNSVPVSSAC